MAKQENIFMAAEAPAPDYTAGSKLVRGQKLVSKKTGEVLMKAIFEDGAEVIFPSGYRRFASEGDICFGKNYECGWTDGSKGGRLFVCNEIK